jgi:hypothetical protein
MAEGKFVSYLRVSRDKRRAEARWDWKLSEQPSRAT